MTRRENETMAKLAEQNRRDSRALKALSVLGTLYLPATFIAVSVSMSLHGSAGANRSLIDLVQLKSDPIAIKKSVEG